MTHLRLNALLAAGCVSLAAIGAANAGGFNRGSANLDGLYGSGEIGIYSGVTYVSPEREYTNARGLVVDASVQPVPVRPFSQDNIEYGGEYVVPYFSVGGRLVGDLSCVASYSRPYGADTHYTGEITYHIAEQTLSTNEYGGTCGYGFDLPTGRLSLIGGAFYETIDYGQARNFETAFGLPGFGDSRIDLESGTWGYRVGLGYEIPEYAVKASLMYRSQTNHDADGEYSNTPFFALASLVNASTPGAFSPAELARYGRNLSTTATASAALPASVEFNLQSGIAEGWLAFGSIKWTNWSVLETIQLVEGINNRAFSTSRFFFEDGWTVTGGVAHRFDDQLAGSLSLAWDKGVSTGWDVLTDTWTIAGGVAYDVNKKVQVRAGGAAIYLTSGEKSKTASTVDYTASAPDEWGFALSASASVKF